MSSVFGLPDWFGKPLAVVLIDLLLAGDNALVIGMICATLPTGNRRFVLVFGTAAAVLLRTGLTLVTGGVLAVPRLKLFAARFVVMGARLLTLLILGGSPVG